MGGGSEKAFLQKQKPLERRGSSDKKFIINFKNLTVYD
jgi:hypothetical protein